MQWYWHDQVGIIPNALPGLQQPAGHKWRQIGAIGMLETQQIIATVVIINQCRTSLIENRLLLVTGTAKCCAVICPPVRRRKFKRISTAATMRRRDKSQLRPAFGTDRMGGIGNHPASATTRRQDRVDPQPYRCPHECRDQFAPFIVVFEDRSDLHPFYHTQGLDYWKSSNGFDRSSAAARSIKLRTLAGAFLPSGWTRWIGIGSGA